MLKLKYALIGFMVGLSFIATAPLALAGSNSDTLDKILSKVKSTYTYVQSIYSYAADTSSDVSAMQSTLNSVSSDVSDISSDVSTINTSLYGTLGIGGMEDDLGDVDTNVESLCSLLNTTARNAYYACTASGGSSCSYPSTIYCY